MPCARRSASRPACDRDVIVSRECRFECLRREWLARLRGGIGGVRIMVMRGTLRRSGLQRRARRAHAGRRDRHRGCRCSWRVSLGRHGRFDYGGECGGVGSVGQCCGEGGAVRGEVGLGRHRRSDCRDGRDGVGSVGGGREVGAVCDMVGLGRHMRHDWRSVPGSGRGCVVSIAGGERVEDARRWGGLVSGRRRERVRQSPRR